MSRAALTPAKTAPIVASVTKNLRLGENVTSTEEYPPPPRRKNVDSDTAHASVQLARLPAWTSQSVVPGLSEEAARRHPPSLGNAGVAGAPDVGSGHPRLPSRPMERSEMGAAVVHVSRSAPGRPARALVDKRQ
ncbi:uncharacterized protein PHACADRAFT_198816 [Phanerochaete carnosa HHB-10118-sp]|uniref:Uncharacterized protein n=1 Tax=Phanerochaete carnosa (strain HHB-10118-sp) TaxID=650164 RepID=K5WQX4_PHACS|nr:uncharacterized protein PHACADRAFT_198816 [Phanerochaete carnosa HHB-10118-sp]EKM52767.1 hypothetical protein PHACADRAFT_198816 [Phanerochaete carnosa HHB-10118-sp]